MNQLHQPYPWHYQDATVVIVDLSVDDAAANALLPLGFEPASRPQVFAWAFSCDVISGVGRYTELMLNMVANRAGRPAVFTPYIYVTNDAAMASGREVLGVPKKIAAIEHDVHNDQIVVRAARSGVDFATLGMTLDREGTAEDRHRLTDWLSHRSLNPGLDGRLIEGGMTADVTRVIHGRGFIDVRPSASDPIYKLCPVATSATYVRGNFTLLEPRIRED